MEKNTVVPNTLPKTAWNSLSQAEKAEIIKVAVKNNITDLKTIRQKYNEFAEGGNIYDGTTMPTQQMQTDATYVNTPIAPVYFPVHQLPEVTVRPDSNLSPAERVLAERARKQAHDRTFGKGSYDAYRRQEQTDYLIDKAARPTNVDRALDYAASLVSGIGQGTDIASMTMGGLPVYSALKGAKALSEKDYVDGAIWMAPMHGVVGKKVYDAVKPVIQRVFVKGTPVAKGAVGKTAPEITSENAANITPEVTHFYHGSPVRFDAFSADFIGSGEGGSKVMRGINLWPVEKIGNAPKFANIKSPDAPLHLGVSSTPLGGELNPTVYDVSGRGLKLYTTTPREVKGLSQSDLISQGYDGIQTPNQVTVFPESIGKLSIDKQSAIDEFILAHPEVERWTPWTTDIQKMQNVIDMSKMSKWTPEQWTAAQDAAIAKGDMAEAQRLRDLHFMVKAPNTTAQLDRKPLQLFHGTDADYNSIDLNKYGKTDGGTFGRGFYTTPIEEYASLYGKNIKPLYMKLDNPKDYRTKEISDIIKEKLAFGEDFATGNGIDGVIGRPSWKGFKGLEEWVSQKPQNVKYSQAITHDDAGNIIPLSKRDNFKINDLRYGVLPFIAGATMFGLTDADSKQKTITKN